MMMIGARHVISSADYEKLTCRLADRDFNVNPRPAPKRRDRRSATNSLTRAELEQVRQALLKSFDW
jgi:hypothetical protein